jgi:ATP adenylyltransferase
MDLLWTPWRYRYMAGAHEAASKLSPANESCVFCELLARGNDAETHIVLRGKRNFVVLNAFPYTSGHLMVVPFEHIGELTALDAETLAEMMLLTQRTQLALARVYAPNGFNIGINQGRAAGAGVAGHVHQHVVPRWIGDTNFMSVTGETRLAPEDLDTTYNKLRMDLGLPLA